MFTVSERVKRIGAAFALAAASVPLAGIVPPVDPSLLAAPEYTPDLWNDVSNENLALFAKRHPRLIEKIVAIAFRMDKEKNAYLYWDNAHTDSARAYTAIRTLVDQSKTKDPELVFSLAAHYRLRTYEIAGAVADANEMYRPKGIQPFNNCLSYGVDDRDRGKEEKDYAATPGHRTLGWDAATKVGYFNRSEYAAFVYQTIRGNEADGMIFTGRKMESREGFYRAALYMRPAKQGADNMYESHEYHYIRQNRDGTWSQKFGGLNVIDTDHSGNIITDPTKADMGPYSFIGYFLVPKGGLDVGPPEEKATKPGTRPAYNSDEIIVIAPARP